MNNEYIPKQQVIDFAESMRNLMAKGVADAFIKGIEGMEATEGQQHWISTKDRMPEKGEWVIINTIDREVFEAFFESGYWENDNSFWAKPNDVTHWMPLPEPPKE